MPDPASTQPAVVFKPHADKKQLVPYNADNALELLRNRDAVTTLAPLWESKSAMTDVPPGLVGRGTLNLKARNAQEAISTTQHDD